MTVPPADPQEHRFKTAIRGFDRKEVAACFAELARAHADATREVQRLRDDVARAQAVLDEHRERERSLRATTATAEKLADDIRRTAEQESQRIMTDAQARAAAVADTIADGLATVNRELIALRARRERAAADVHATIALLRTTADNLKRADDARPRSRERA
jgi:cell division initiation protein